MKNNTIHSRDESMAQVAAALNLATIIDRLVEEARSSTNSSSSRSWWNNLY